MGSLLISGQVCNGLWNATKQNKQNLSKQEKGGNLRMFLSNTNLNEGYEETALLLNYKAISTAASLYCTCKAALFK